MFMEHLLYTRRCSGCWGPAANKAETARATKLTLQRERPSESCLDRQAVLFISHSFRTNPSCLVYYWGVTVRFLIVEHFHSVTNMDDLWLAFVFSLIKNITLLLNQILRILILFVSSALLSSRIQASFPD